MKAPTSLTASAVAILLAGCATQYKQGGWTGGFSESQLAPNVWRVTFKGNGYTADERARDMALLRSADLTLLNGYTHFALADETMSSRTAAISTPGTAYTKGSATVIGNNIYGQARTRYTPGQTMFVQFPSANNTVVMFKGRPDDVPLAFEAQFICESLGKKYMSACAAQGKSTAPAGVPASSRQLATVPMQAAVRSAQVARQEVVACVPAGSVAGRTVTLKEWGEVLVKEVWNANPHCNFASMAGTVTATILVHTPEGSQRDAAATPRVPAAGRSIEERLRELKRLREQDLITQEQFEAKQRSILAEQ